MKFEAITFDLWNTLIEVKTYRPQRMAFFRDVLAKKKYFVEEEKFSAVYQEVNNFGHNYSELAGYRHIHTLERLKKMLELFEIKLSQMDLQRIRNNFETVLLNDPPPLKPHVIPVLKKLSKNFSLAMISDTGITPGSNLRKMLKNYGVLKYFKTTTFSDETGYFKPHKHNFLHTLNRLNIEPTKALHVGDILQTDILGAKKVGMSAAWVESPEYYVEGTEQTIKPDFTIKDLDEVLTIVDL